MLKTMEELKTFLSKQPTKGQITVELQDLNKEIKRLDSIRVEYGNANSRLSNDIKKKNNCWTHHTNYNVKDRQKFNNNITKRQQLIDQITDLVAIKKELMDYKPIEYVQGKLDFAGLTEQLQKYI